MEPKSLKGFRDLLPAQVAVRQQILAIARQEARLGGFQEIATPFLEYSEILLGEGGETDKQVFRFKDHGDRDVALRYDLTMPFARYAAAQRAEISLPFRRLQIGEVFRGEKPQKGRYREFMQCDLDIIGADTLLADAEIIAGLMTILHKATELPMTMKLGHRQILVALIQKFLPVASTSEAQSQVLIALDKLEKIGAAAVSELLCKADGVTKESADQLLAAVGQNFEKTAQLLKSDEVISVEIDRLAKLQNMLAGLRVPKFKIEIDLRIARGLAYYTGVVFETTLDDLQDMGSICSGGRYNQLTSRFSSLEMPGVGGSIGVDRLLAALEELGKVPAQSPSLVFVAVADQSAAAYAFEMVAELRKSGISSEIAVTEQKLGKQLQQANKKNILWVIVIGEQEAQNKVFNCKNMTTGSEDKDLKRTDLIAYFQKHLNLKG